MKKDYIPGPDGELKTWSANIKTLVAANFAAYGLTSGQSTLLTTKQGLYSTSYDAAVNPATRGTATVLAKTQARRDLVSYCRMLARIIQANPAVTVEMKQALGLTLHDVQPTPIPIPAESPTITIKSAVNRTVRIKLGDRQNPETRGKPAGAAGAAIFSFVGEEPPAGIDGWKFEGNITRTQFDVVFPDTVPSGATVWLTAFWFNPRHESSVATPPVSTNLPGGGVSAIAA